MITKTIKKMIPKIPAEKRRLKMKMATTIRIIKTISPTNIYLF